MIDELQERIYLTKNKKKPRQRELKTLELALKLSLTLRHGGFSYANNMMEIYPFSSVEIIPVITQISILKLITFF